MKLGWYSQDNIAQQVEWRSKLPVEWRGSQPVQFKVPGLKYTSVLQVPSSKDSRLLRAVARVEPR